MQHIKWAALGEVFLVGLGLTLTVVLLYTLGVASLGARAVALDAVPATGGRFGRVRGATAVASVCFAACALVVGYGVYLIVQR
jgi:hypothetical protein